MSVRRPLRKLCSLALVALLILAAYLFGSATGGQTADVRRAALRLPESGYDLSTDAPKYVERGERSAPQADFVPVRAEPSALAQPQRLEGAENAPSSQSQDSTERAEPSRAAPPTASASLARGDRGAEVEALQARLNAVGFPAGSADGQFGGKTESAVRAFQAAAGLPETGEADAETRRLLFSARALLYAPEDDGEDAPMVWIPRTGKRYHSSERCSNMKDPSRVTLAKAERRGFTPCKKCYG